MTIELFRWSTDAERAPLIAALSAPPPPPATAAAAPAAGRGAGRAAGRGGRGGRAAAPPLSPAERFEAAIKAAPTYGYVWGEGVTGYSIKYAWRSPTAGGDRIVLVTARRLGTPASSSNASSSNATPAAIDGDFTIIEMHLDGKGVGEGKAATANVIVDPEAQTLALDLKAPSPMLLKVTR